MILTIHQLLIILSFLLVLIGLFGVASHKNALIILMSLELMLNGVALSFVTFAHMHQNLQGIIFVFMMFVIVASEVALAILILLKLMKSHNNLDIEQYSQIK